MRVMLVGVGLGSVGGGGGRVGRKGLVVDKGEGV